MFAAAGNGYESPTDDHQTTRLTTMGQFKFLPNESSSPAAAVDLSGFAPFYALLRGLAAVQGEATFYERLEVLLQLARWTDAPPTALDLARVLGKPVDALSGPLSALRSAGWLVSGVDDRRYVLTPQGHILIVLLQLLAQPWTEDAVAPVATQIYAAAENLGVKTELLRTHFETVLAVLEERTRQIIAAIGAEDTALVESRLNESKRNAALGQQALKLRREGAVSPDDHHQAQRMHDVLSRLSHASGELELRYQALLTRDLLAEGGVTLGDILDWAREAEDAEMAETLLPFMADPYLPVWALPEMALIAGGETLLGHTAPRRSTRLPKPVPLAEIPPAANISEVKQRIYQVQETLRRRLAETDPLSLVTWVDQESWPVAVLHFIAALDPQLGDVIPPIFLHLDGQGRLDSCEGAVQTVTAGSLSHIPVQTSD
ncbi:MAG: hypothetical protein JXA21_04710 [Anaerolineae bacterium]|nr:hypothetical protein [Anaerolineae bacterium]